MFKRIILYTMLFSIVPLTVWAVTVDETVMEEGIRSVDDLYDSQKAIRKFREVLVSETASEELKVKACFWLAHTYLFEGEEEKAGRAIDEIFKVAPDADYDFAPLLPGSIKRNNKLMYLFNSRREAALEDREAAEEVYEEKAEPVIRERAREEKLTFGKIVVSTFMTAAYIVLVLL